MTSLLQERFSYPVVSAQQADPAAISPTDYGEIPTGTKITDLSRYPRDTLADTLGAIYSGASADRRSGVLEGLVPSASSAVNMTVRVEAGTALYYDLSLGRSVPVVCRYDTVTLDAPDATHDRYDLICAQPDGGNYNEANRLVKYGTGVVDVLSLPYSYREGCELVVYKGTPAASPAVPSCAMYDVPIALVLVRSGSAGLIASADVFDVRPWLSPRVGGSMSYRAFLHCDSSSTVELIAEEVSDPTLKIATSMARGSAGVYTAIVRVPLTFGAAATSAWTTSRPRLWGSVGGALGWDDMEMFYGRVVLTQVRHRVSGGYWESWIWFQVVNDEGAAIDPPSGKDLMLVAEWPRAD